MSRPKKPSNFRKYGWREKSSLGRAQIYFFDRFSRDILFSSLVYFTLFDSYFCICLLVSLFVCCFLKSKMCILMHIRLCRRVSDKIFFARPISGNKTTFFDLKYTAKKKKFFIKNFFSKCDQIRRKFLCSDCDKKWPNSFPNLIMKFHYDLLATQAFNYFSFILILLILL